MVQVYMVTGPDKAQTIAKANEFMKTLRAGQFISIQMNPLQEAVVTERKQAYGNQSYTEKTINQFSFTVMVMYEDKVDEPARPHYTSG